MEAECEFFEELGAHSWEEVRAHLQACASCQEQLLGHFQMYQCENFNPVLPKGLRDQQEFLRAWYLIEDENSKAIARVFVQMQSVEAITAVQYLLNALHTLALVMANKAPRILVDHNLKRLRKAYNVVCQEQGPDFLRVLLQLEDGDTIDELMRRWNIVFADQQKN